MAPDHADRCGRQIERASVARWKKEKDPSAGEEMRDDRASRPGCGERDFAQVGSAHGRIVGHVLRRPSEGDRCEQNRTGLDEFLDIGGGLLDLQARVGIADAGARRHPKRREESEGQGKGDGCSHLEKSRTGADPSAEREESDRRCDYQGRPEGRVCGGGGAESEQVECKCDGRKQASDPGKPGLRASDGPLGPGDERGRSQSDQTERDADEVARIGMAPEAVEDRGHDCVGNEGGRE